MLALQLRFRERRVALRSDIEAMFMQVKVRTEDRQFLRFLWNKEISSVPDVFEYERHIFGARDSPTCANYAVRKCAEDQQKKNPTPSNKYRRTSIWMITLHRSTQ